MPAFQRNGWKRYEFIKVMLFFFLLLLLVVDDEGGFPGRMFKGFAQNLLSKLDASRRFSLSVNFFFISSISLLFLELSCLFD